MLHRWSLWAHLTDAMLAPQVLDLGLHRSLGSFLADVSADAFSGALPDQCLRAGRDPWSAHDTGL